LNLLEAGTGAAWRFGEKPAQVLRLLIFTGRRSCALTIAGNQFSCVEYADNEPPSHAEQLFVLTMRSPPKWQAKADRALIRFYFQSEGMTDAQYGHVVGQIGGALKVVRRSRAKSLSKRCGTEKRAWRPTTSGWQMKYNPRDF
jgi:hypothetical protein